MPLLNLKRGPFLTGMARSLTVLADGKKLASLRYTEIKTVDLSIGDHYLEAKMGWCKSEPFLINLSAAEPKTLVIDCVSPLEAGIRAWIPPFVIFTIRQVRISK